MSPSVRVRTLLDFLPARSLGLHTSVPGRITFLLGSSTMALVLMRSRPMSFVPQGLLVLSALALMWSFGARRFLRSRASFMLLCACVFIGIVNAVFPESYAHTAPSAVSYGLTRTLAFAGMAYSTLLVAAITRPSDIARFGLRCRFPWYPFLLAAIPFASLDALANRYRDILLVVRARYAPSGLALRATVVDAAASLFSTTLHLAIHHHQLGVVSRPIPWSPASTCAQMSATPLVAWQDAAFVAALTPSVIGAWLA